MIKFRSKMKRIINILILAAGAFAAACQQDATDGGGIVTGDYVTFTGGMNTLTRTQIAVEAGKMSIEWKGGDCVGIYGRRGDHTLGANYAYDVQPDGANAASCLFRCKNEREAYQNPVAGDAFYAYYPYSAHAGSDPKAVAVSLPAKQHQSTTDALDNIEALGFMKSVPASAATAESGVNLEFHNVFAIVELKLKLAAPSTLSEVPISQIRMTSTAADLVIPSGEIDLTAPVEAGYSNIPVTVNQGSRSVTMAFSGMAPVTKKEGSFYFVVAPGTHPAGSITLEVTAAANGSVNTIELPGDVTFLSNRHYTKSVELRLDDFKSEDTFDVIPESTTVRKGEALSFQLVGPAMNGEFWSGEKGHRYAFAQVGETVDAEVFLRFGSEYVNGLQRNSGSVKYSTDFSGDYTEASVKAATWIDVTNQFQLPPYISGSSASNPSPDAARGGRLAGKPYDAYDSGTVDISSWFKDEQTPLYVAFFYHVDKKNANAVDEWTGKTGNTRTMWYLYYVSAEYAYPNDEVRTPLFSAGLSTSDLQEGGDTNWSGMNIVHWSSYDGEKNTCSTQGATGITVIRMTASANPTSDRDAQCITSAIMRPAAHVLSADTGEAFVKESDDSKTLTYTFETPGIYTVTFVGELPTLAGFEKAVREFTITVTE